MTEKSSKPMDKDQNDFNVRRFRKNDVVELLEMMKALAEYEDYIDQFRVNSRDLVQHGLGETPSFLAWVAETKAGKLTGMAVAYIIPWTYDMKPTLVLKELYIKPQWRSNNVGGRLLQSVFNYAGKSGAGHVNWTVLKTNDNAKRFYRRNGGILDEKWELWGMNITTDER